VGSLLAFGSRRWSRAYEKEARASLDRQPGLSCVLGVVTKACGEEAPVRHTRRAKPFCLSFEDGLLSELSRGGEESCDIVLSVPLEAVASLLGTRHISPLLAESIEVHYPAEALAPVAMPPFDGSSRSGVGRCRTGDPPIGIHH
jgi:hypothetical protein